MIRSIHLSTIKSGFTQFSLKTTLLYIVSLIVIFVCLFVGNQLEHLLHIPIPGSILGMIVLFLLMVTGILKVEWIRPGASLFLRWMVFLFLPISVGLMDHFDMLLNNALPILVSIIGGTAIVLVILSLGLEHIAKKGE